MLRSVGKNKRPVRRKDPYREAQARQRKSANLSRQKILQKERLDAMGDPVRSKSTPFVESLTAIQASSPTSPENATSMMNFFVSVDEMNRSIEHSRYLTEPLGESPQPGTDVRRDTDPKKAVELAKQAAKEAAREKAARIEKHTSEHENARKALAAIAALEHGNSKDRTRVNVQRCINEFGRHNTDRFLPPKPPSVSSAHCPAQALATSTMTAADGSLMAQRVGPDTGSSEVQAAILTAKINVLADNIGKKDKHNKRNLRLLVHRRQKLLSYLRRKERGGPRWQNLVEKLGIADAMWQGEISL